MSEEQIDVQAVIDQLMTRIAQLELEVAVLKAMGSKISSHIDLPASDTPQNPEESGGGYI